MTQFMTIDRVMPFEETHKFSVVGLAIVPRINLTGYEFTEPKIVACCDLSWDDDMPFISGVFVHPDHRRQGIAREMMKFVIEQAVNAGKRSLALYVRKDNLAAQALYQSLGFDPYLVNGDDIFMGRKLRIAPPVAGGLSASRRWSLSEPRKPQFVECSPCGEIWKYATIPMAADLYLKALKSLVCPNCGETRMLVM